MKTKTEFTKESGVRVEISGLAPIKDSLYPSNVFILLTGQYRESTTHTSTPQNVKNKHHH